jgi:hypothetical protein
MSSPTNDNKDNTAVQDASVAVVDPTTVDKENSDMGGVRLLVPEMKANDDDADLLVDEMNKSSTYVLADKKRHSNEIDLMQDTIRRQLMIDQYRFLWGKDNGYQSPNSDQKASVDDKKDKNDEEDEDA